jgi:four helix bundle protein
VAEAQFAESGADFIHKYCIARKEARECEYWLELLARAEFLPSRRLAELKQETGEIIAIITTIILNRRRNLKTP